MGSLGMLSGLAKSVAHPSMRASKILFASIRVCFGLIGSLTALSLGLFGHRMEDAKYARSRNGHCRWLTTYNMAVSTN